MSRILFNSFSCYSCDRKVTYYVSRIMPTCMTLMLFSMFCEMLNNFPNWHGRYIFSILKDITWLIHLPYLQQKQIAWNNVSQDSICYICDCMWDYSFNDNILCINMEHLLRNLFMYVLGPVPVCVCITFKVSWNAFNVEVWFSVTVIIVREQWQI